MPDVVACKATPIKLPKNVLQMNENQLNEHIIKTSEHFYNDSPKELQVEAVAALARGHHCFVRAGTGYGKTRISEMVFNLFKKKSIVLVLNPLDSLGDDQVREKALVKISAINLNKMTMNFDTILKIKKGDYSFVYLIPEVFLNCSLFTEMFFTSQFQNMLSLIVIDEAHMIYLWGLVATRQSKTCSSFDRHQDITAFRPSYGSMGLRLMATKNVPLLLLSATCRPIAVDAIRGSLMMQPEDMKMVNGELTRPEIRIIRIMMDSTLSSCDDLLRIYAPHSQVPAEKSLPTIIYSGTRNATFQVMKVVNEARNTKYHEYDPEDQFIRRYHSVTGEADKTDNMKDYAAKLFPVMSATMALGLGQNLKRVRSVIHMGRGDPACITQMVGRCGRDGNPGLAFLFMERSRPKGKNNLEDFENVHLGDADIRMDALAITPVCLRVAMTIDNQIGYIPISVDDPNYIAEQKRESQVGFAPCKCSNCGPLEADAIVNLAQQITIDNFEEILRDPLSVTKDPTIKIMERVPRKKKIKHTCDLPVIVADILLNHLVDQFETFFAKALGPSTEFLASDFFGIEQAKAVVGSFNEIRNVKPHDLRHMESVIGGEFFPGQVEQLNLAITNWFEGNYYKTYKLGRQAHIDFIVSEEIRLREGIEAAVLERARLKTEAADMARRKKEADKELGRILKKKDAEEAAAIKLAAKEHAPAMKKKKSKDTALAKAVEKEHLAALKKLKAEEMAEIKASERHRRLEEQQKKREMLFAAKAEEKQRRKETKELNKKRAEVNRDNREKKKAHHLETQEDTQRVLMEKRLSQMSNQSPIGIDASEQE